MECNESAPSPDNSKKISAILVTFNSEVTLKECINSLVNSLSKHCDEIIVVDNSSVDRTREILKQTLKTERLIFLNRNIGFAAGVNLGISYSSGQYIMLVNPDLILNQETIDGMLSFLKNNEKAAAVGPKLIYPNGDRQPSCRRYPTMRAVLCSEFPFIKRFIWKEHLHRYNMVDTHFNGPVEVQWLIGACILIKRKAWHDIGTLDECFFLYREDTDWCYRALKKGWKIYCLSELYAIHHYKRESAKGLNRQFIWHILSLVKFYRKHGFKI